jgi:AraC family cel operon transcriptional repressor
MRKKTCRRDFPILRWRAIAGSAPFHAARYVKTAAQPTPRHGHDFAELFWIDAGRGEHLVNGARHPLQPGSLVLMRPEDEHGIRTAPGDPLRLTNIAFPRQVLEGLGTRYFADRRDFFWTQKATPCAREIDAAFLRRLNHWADELSQAPRERLQIDLFLLHVLAELSGAGQRQLPERAPAWLLQACGRMREPGQLAGGVENFFRLCGRSREHVARTARQHLGTTPTDYVNQLRMAQARRQLEMGDRDILEVALDCGIGNLSHFYELFRRDTGTTPRAYRLAHRRPL